MSMRSNKWPRALVYAVTIALASMGAAAPAQAADAHPVFISFETGDNGGAVAVSNAGPFGGASTSIIDSTHLTGKALQFTKSGNVWAGVNLLLTDTSSYAYADATHTVITLDYWSNDSVASPVMLKLTGTSACVKAVEAQPGLNHLSFDMSTGTGWDATQNYNLVTLFPDFGADDTTYKGASAVALSDQKYEIDNISFNGGTASDILAAPVAKTAGAVFMSFEANDTLGTVATSNAGPFGGPTTSIADSTHLTGKSLKFVKSGEVWGGVNLLIAGSTAFKYTDANHKVITLDYWSNDTVKSPVMLKLTTSGGGFAAKSLETSPGLNHLSFDMSTGTGWDATAEYTIVTLFPDFGADDSTYTGAGSIDRTGQVYEIDNISINGGLPPKVATSTLLTFESDDALGAKLNGVATGDKPQGGFEGAVTSIAPSPAGGTGGNALKIVKATGGQVYAGVNMLLNTSFRIGDGTHKTITFNYYSPKDNSPVRIELVPYPVSLGMNVTAKKGWQMLSFDISQMTGASNAAWSADTEYTSLALFPDFNNAADNSVYYVDDFAVNGATTPMLPPATVAPAVTKAAAITGTAKVGKSLTASATFSGTPAATNTYKWYRCTVAATAVGTAAPAASAKCSVISGATGASYKVVAADVGKYIRVLVTGTNSAGAKLSLSKSTAKATK